MSNIQELKDVLKEALEDRGVLNQMRAKIRSEIFQTIGEESNHEKPEVSNENLVINELIREYMAFNNYNHSLAVFLPETGQPQKPAFNRQQLAQKLKIQENQQSKELPLIYGLTFGLKQILNKEETQRKELKEDIFGVQK